MSAGAFTVTVSVGEDRVDRISRPYPEQLTSVSLTTSRTDRQVLNLVIGEQTRGALKTCAVEIVVGSHTSGTLPVTTVPAESLPLNRIADAPGVSSNPILKSEANSSALGAMPMTNVERFSKIM